METIARQLETEDDYRMAARLTPQGKLLVRYRYEPWDTESAARDVAEKASKDIEKLKASLSTIAYFAKEMPEARIGEPDWRGMAECAFKILKELE